MIRSVRNHCKEQLNLFNKYLLLVTFETDDNYSIPFEISNNSSTIRFDSKWKNTIRTALPNTRQRVSFNQSKIFKVALATQTTD